MSGVSASHLVIFIASIVVAAGVAGTLVTQVDRVSTSIVDQSDEVEAQIDTEIRIVSDPGSPESIYDGEDLTVYIKNTGDQDLEIGPGTVDVLIEGSFNEPDDVERVDDSDATIWDPGTVIEVTVEEADVEGETRVSVAAGGNEDTIRISD